MKTSRIRSLLLPRDRLSLWGYPNCTEQQAIASIGITQTDVSRQFHPVKRSHVMRPTTSRPELHIGAVRLALRGSQRHGPQPIVVSRDRAFQMNG